MSLADTLNARHLLESYCVHDVLRTAAHVEAIQGAAKASRYQKEHNLTAFVLDRTKERINAMAASIGLTKCEMRNLHFMATGFECFHVEFTAVDGKRVSISLDRMVLDTMIKLDVPYPQLLRDIDNTARYIVREFALHLINKA